MRALLILFAIIAFPVIAAEELTVPTESQVKITSPKNGSSVNPSKPGNLEFSVVLAGDDTHFYVYVDGVKVQKLRPPANSYPLGKLRLGKHEICIQTFDKNNTSPGVKSCININASSESNCFPQCMM